MSICKKYYLAILVICCWMAFVPVIAQGANNGEGNSSDEGNSKSNSSDLTTIITDRANSANTADPLLTLNSAFIVAYSRAKMQALATAGPVIISQTDRLIFLKNGERFEAAGIPLRITVKMKSEFSDREK